MNVLRTSESFQLTRMLEHTQSHGFGVEFHTAIAEDTDTSPLNGKHHRSQRKATTLLLALKRRFANDRT